MMGDPIRDARPSNAGVARAIASGSVELVTQLSPDPLGAMRGAVTCLEIGPGCASDLRGSVEFAKPGDGVCATGLDVDTLREDELVVFAFAGAAFGGPSLGIR